MGIAPYGEAIKISVEKGFDGAQALLSRVCLPAAEELGLMFQDKVRYWRLNNIIRIIQKSGNLFDFDNEKLKLTAHPRVVKEILDNGSWCDDDGLQDMWAGLIASSCNQQAGDDSNLPFANTLKSLTSRQAKILKFICESCEIKVDKNDFVFAEHIEIGLEELSAVVDTKDIHVLDTELDYLRSNELLMNDDVPLIGGHGAGFVFGQDKVVAHLEPSPFAIALYVKSQGYKGSPKEFYNLTYIEPEKET